MADEKSVPPTDQGPNEQSIVASGMTVEEWQEKHPKQPLGPAPEDIGQVTTDPPDGSELTDEEAQVAAEAAFPSLKTEPEHNLTDEGGENPQATQMPAPPTEVSDLNVPQVGTTGSDEGEEDDDDVGGHGHSHTGLTTHAQLNDYVAQNNLTQPDDWNNMTVADKKSWLDLQPVR